MPRSRDSSPDERLIDAARELFAECGVAALSTDRLAKEARVSKASLYKYFGGKSELFAAIIDKDSEEFKIAPDLDFETASEFLNHVIEFGAALSRLLARPEIQRMTGAVINHAGSDPETAQLYFDRTVETCRKDLTKLIDKGVKRGFVTRDIPSRRLATYLLSLWEGIDHYRHKLQLKERPKAMSRSVVEECCRMVLGIDT
ncbi:MAG: TetR/AcrR family transcriptional regulator [Myxococcota bacterium]